VRLASSVVVHDHRGRDERLSFERIGRQHVERIAHPDDDDVFVFGGQAQPAVSADGRRLEAQCGNGGRIPYGPARSRRAGKRA
jgi:hypothetical protein